MAYWTVNVPKGKPNLMTDNPVVVGVSDSIYFFGDYDSEQNLTSIGPFDVQVFRTDTYQWSILKNENFSLNEMLPHLIHWRTAVVYKDLVYLFADINKKIWNVLFVYDTNSNVWMMPIVTGSIPDASAQFSCNSTCVVNDAIYMFGGFNSGSSMNFQDVYKLDLKPMKWSLVSTTGQPPIHRFGHSITAIKNWILIYGGSGERKGIAAYDDIVYLDTQTMTWVTPEVVGYRPAGRTDHSSVCYKGSLLVFGGFESDLRTATAYKDFVQFDPDSRCWFQVKTNGNGPDSMYFPSCVLIKDRVFVLGGLPNLWPIFSRPDPLHDIHVCDFAPSLRTLSILAVLEHKLDQKGLPETIQYDIKLTNPEEF